MGLRLKLFFDKETTHSPCELYGVNHPEVAALPVGADSLPNFKKEYLIELIERVNASILKECADKDIVFPSGFEPIESLGVTDITELYWDTEGKQTDCMVQNARFVMNLPRVFFDPKYVGCDMREVAFPVQCIIERHLGLYDHQWRDFQTVLSDGNRIWLASPDSELTVNVPSEIFAHFKCFELLDGQNYTLVSDPDVEDFFTFSPTLDLDHSGRPVIKIFYDLRAELSKEELSEIAGKLLTDMDHHQQLYAVHCEPASHYMYLDQAVDASKEHIITVNNPNYNEAALNQQATIEVQTLIPSLK